MSQLVAKLMLALLMLPTAAAIYIVGMVIGMEMGGWGNDVPVFTVLGIIALLYIAGYWLLLWRRSVVWTPHRIGATVAVTIGALFVGAVIGGIGAAVIQEPSFGIFLGTVCIVLAWLLGTVLAWRETNDERAARIRAAGGEAVACLNCGYNLTGLRHTTCPECGAQPTIEELLAGQASHAERELASE